VARPTKRYSRSIGCECTASGVDTRAPIDVICVLYLQIVPIMCSITSLTQCVLDAHWLPLPFKSVLVRVLQASGSIISPQQFTARDNDGWGYVAAIAKLHLNALCELCMFVRPSRLSSLVLFAISASVGAWYLHRNQHPPDRQP